ncbi:MAG: type III pantothenate kinase [Sedimentisphaerales bacterium]|nr:type III pantothenate kinase [Sedimentisphaerales bacterium]
MNVIAIDIGNTNINIALFLDNEEQSIESIAGDSKKKIENCLKTAWEKIPVLTSSKEKKRDGVIVVSSVKPDWTKVIKEIAKKNFDEKIYIIGKEIPLPISLWVDEPEKVGTDRVVAAAAAYDVIGNAVVVADFGTAVTIDLVDDNGIFLGGVICPGFEISAKALRDNTAQLPNIKVTKPNAPYGKNTADAINCGLYYANVGLLQEITRRYAEELGNWPQTIITGSGAKTIHTDCEFADDYVPNLVVRGVFLAYKKFIESKQEAE